MAADAAVRGIREVDPQGTVGLVGAEPHPPYSRPPLSKGLWKGAPLDRVWRRTEELGVALHLGRTVRALDLVNREASDDAGQVYGFQRLLLATGGTPRSLGGVPEQASEGRDTASPGEDGVIYFRTLDDYHLLRRLAEERERFLVVGGGFIGSEIAAALAQAGKRVTMAFLEEGVGARLFPRQLSLFLNDYYRQRGVEVLLQPRPGCPDPGGARGQRQHPGPQPDDPAGEVATVRLGPAPLSWGCAAA
jgi:NADPH-dependent 2,4-dienoyl-CoA reductase/sulfur reductase-like enzyme